MKKRHTLDDKGNPLTEVRNRDGIYEPEFDAETVSKLNADALSIADTGKQPAAPSLRGRRVGTNPYQGASVTDAKKLRKRSGLDYLRTLSTEIKKKRD